MRISDWSSDVCSSDLANGCDILRNRVSGQKLARLILEAGIADLAGATAHDHDGLVPCALQLPQHHDGYQMADVQRRRSRIEADISRYNLLRRYRVQPFGIGDLMNVAARFEQAEKVGLKFAHNASADRKSTHLNSRH